MGKWEESTIGDQFTIKTGGTPSKSKPEYYKNGNIPWLVSGDINRIEINECDNYINELGLKSSNARILPKDIVMMALNGQGKTKGSVAILNIEAACNQSLVGIIPKDKESQSSKFLFYYLQSQYLNIRKLAGGDDRRGLNMGLIRSIKFNFPKSLPEQKRIVAKLDGIFEKLDVAIKLLEENIAHTQALMGSVLDEIYSDGDVMIKDVCTVGPKKSEVKDLDDTLEVSFLPMRDLNEHEINFKPNEIKKLKEVYKGYTYFADGDIILAKVTPCFENGKAGLAKGLLNGIGFGSSEYHVLRPNENVLPEWVYFAVLTEQFRVTGKENMTGAGGLKRVPRPFLEEWKIPVPKLSIQKKQIKRIVQIQEETKKLNDSITQNLEDLKQLKSSLLDQAFKGEL